MCGGCPPTSRSCNAKGAPNGSAFCFVTGFRPRHEPVMSHTRSPNDAVHDCGRNGMGTTMPAQGRANERRGLYRTGRSQMAKWIRFEQGGKTGFGTLEGDNIAVHTGDLFAGAKPSGRTLKLSDVQLLTPCDPSKMICLWNNFHQLAAKNDFKEPKEPLWFLKAPNAYWPANRPIERPATYAGKIIYEGELGVVIGKKCFNIIGSRGRRLYFRLHLRERRHRGRSLAQGQIVRTMGARQELRHLRRVWSGDRDRPRSDEAVDQDRPERQGAAELSGRRHVLPAAPAGRRHFQGRDADAGRHHRLRHLARRRHHG